MTSEADIPESLIMQARDEEDIDKTEKQCILPTENHPKEHATIKNVLLTHYKQEMGTHDDEQRKINIKVGNGNSENTDGESFLYSPSVEKVAYEDTVRQSKDFPEAISDDAIITISKTKIQQDSKKVATAEEADELPTGRPGLDEKDRETSDSMIFANQEPESGHHNEEKVGDIKKDNDAYNENLDNLNLLEVKTVEFPVCILDEPLEGLKIDLKSEDFEKTFTAAVKGPRTMAQKDDEEKVDSTGHAVISVSHTFSYPTDSNKESLSKTVKNIKELGVSSWESINTVGEKKGLNEVGKNHNLEEIEDTTRSNIMLTKTTDIEGKSFESNTDSHRDKIYPDEGDQNEQDTFISETDSGNSAKGPPETAMENPEECTVKATMRQEGRETENLEEVLKLSSEYIEAGETTDDVTYSEQGETKSDIVSSEDQRNENHTVGAGNYHTSIISQDNEDDLLFSNNREAIERRDEKQDLCTEFQPEDQENQETELSKEESFHKDQASEVSKNKEFTHSEGNSDEDMKKIGAGFTTSITKEEMMQEFMESNQEKIPEMQNEKESTEAETKGKVSNYHLQERKIASDAKEEPICKDDSTSVSISPEPSAWRIEQSSFEVEEADISSEEKKQYIDQDESQGQNGSTLLKEEHTYDIIMQDSTDRSMDDNFPKDELKNQIFDENDSGKAETNQEIVENSPSQYEVTEILNDSMKFIEVDATTDRQHENLEDEDIYNLLNGVQTEKDIKAESGSNEVQMDINTYAQIGSDEIHEEKIVGKEEIVNQSSKESNSCSEKQGQEITEAYTPVIEIGNLVLWNDEMKRIANEDANEDIQVSEVEEEAAIGKQECSRETEDQTTNGGSTYMVRGVDFKQENENFISIVEDMNQVTNAESDNYNVLQDKKTHEQNGYNQGHKAEMVNNEEYMNQSSGEGNSCNEKQDQQKAKASTPHIEAEFPISSKGECTRVSSEEVQVIEIEDEAAIDKQPFTSKTHTIPEVTEEILLANVNSKSALEDLNQDKNAQLGSTEVEKYEKENEENCFSEIHETEAVNNEEILNQSFEESNSWTETRDKEIAQASTPPLGAENLSQCYNDCTWIARKDIQVSEIEKETAIGAIEQQIMENENPNNIQNGVLSCVVKGVEILQENENSMNIIKDMNQDINTRSITIEVQTHEQTGSNEYNEMGEANNGKIVIQKSEVSDHCGGNQDQEISQGFTHLIKVENLVLSNEESTSSSSEGIQVSEVNEEATIDEQQCMLENTNRAKTGVYSYEAKGVEVLLEKENSLSIMEDVNQDLNARGSIEVQKTEKTNAHSSSYDIQEIQAVNNEDILNQSYEESNSCSEKIDKDTAKAYTPQIKARNFYPSNNECTMMSSDEIKVSEDNKETTIEEQQCCAMNEHPNGVSSDEVMRVKSVKRNQNFKDIDQDMKSESDSIEVLQDENSHNQAGSKDIHEIEAVNNEEIVSQISKESNSSCGKEDQDFSQTSAPHLEAKNDVQSIDECTSICSEEIQVSEVVRRAAVEKKQCISHDEDPNKTTTNVYSNDATRMEIVEENEISMNKVGHVDQDINAVSDNIEVLQAENMDEQTGTKVIHDTILANNEEIMDKSSDEEGSFCERKNQETNDACALLVEVIHHAPTQDECTIICNEEFQVSEVEEKSTIDKHQCSSETEDPNKTREGVYSLKDMNSHSNEEQKDEKTNEQIFSNEIHEMEGFSNQQTVNQSFEENDSYSGKQDQECSPTSTLLLETTDPISSNNEWTRPPSEEVKVGEVEEEAVIVEQRCNAENGDPNKIKNGVLPIEVRRAEIVQDNENYHDIVEDVIQKGTFKDIVTESDNIEAQAHIETSLYKIQDTKMANQEEVVNQSSEENTCSGKQDQGTAEASEVRRKDECTRINGEDIQVIDVKEEVVVEKLECSSKTKNVNKITDGICPSKVKGLEIEQENESTMNIEQDLDQGKILQPESREVQQVEQTHKKTCLNEFNETEAVRQHVEIEDQSSKESDSSNDKQDQEMARASKPIEDEYHVPRIDESTRISSSTVEEEETIEKHQCNFEDPNNMKHDESSYEGIQVDNVSESKLNQTAGTETSRQNGSIKMDDLDQSQSAKKSNDHTQLIEFSKVAGFESEHHKHENEDPRDMTNRLEEEVKHTNRSISTNEIDTVSEKVKYEELGASIAGEVSTVQNVLAPEFGIPREIIDKEEKQGVDYKTKALSERNNMKALEVSSTEDIQPSSVKKEFPQKVEALDIEVAGEIKLIKLTEIDHDSQDNASTELYAKKFLKDQEFDDAKHEAKLSKATISDINSQDITEITTDETAQKHIWQASEPLDLQEPSSKECEQTIESIKTEDRDESTKTMKVQKDEKPNDSSEKTSQETCSLEEEQKDLEVSKSDFIPSVVLLKPVVKNVTTTDILNMPEPENQSSETQGANSASEYELNSGLEMLIYSCSEESKRQNECRSLEKSEQINDISVQHESSPELISKRNVVNMCEIASDILGKNDIFEHTAKQYDQEWINSKDCNKVKKEKAANTELVMGENKSKEDREECKDPICDTTITEVSSLDDSMKEIFKQPCEKNAYVRVNHLVQNHEILHKLTESNEMNGSNSQEALLQRDMGEDFDVNTSVETEKINDRKMFLQEIDKLSTRDAEEITDVSQLERDSSNVSSKETKANQFSEKLELDDAKRGIKFQDQMATHMHYQDVIETDVVARHISRASETDVKLQAPSYQNLEETNETSKLVAEMEGKTNDSLSENEVKEICVPEKEQKELKVLNLKDESIDDTLSKQELVEIVQKTGDSTMREPKDLSVELEATSSTAKCKTSTEPMNYLEPSSQTILNKTKVQDLKSTEYHELTKSSNQAPEPIGEETAKSEKTLQDKDHQKKSNELIAEETSLNNFGAHEATTDVVNYDKIAVLLNDPTLAQQNLQETESHDNEEKGIIGEEQEAITEFSNSFVDDGTDAKATRQGLLEHKDSEGLNEIQNMRELNILRIEEKEQEHQEKCDKLLDSSQFQDSLSNVSKEASIDDIKQLQADNKEEHNEIEACAQKGLSTIESKRNGVTSNDPVKENSERAVTVNNSSIAKNGYSEQIGENLNKTQTHSITLDTTNKQQEIILHRDTNENREDAAGKPKSNEENDNEYEESELKLPLISEGLREIETKTTQKRSQNILSGVGSKVKHSISKVKKAITCSSSQFASEEVIIKLNKNKKN